MLNRQQAFINKRPKLKGGLHVHTTRSDGSNEPGEMIRYYKKNGYDFLSITDHQIYNYNNFAQETGILVIPGMEFGNSFDYEAHNGFRCFHTVCLGPAKEDGNGFEDDIKLPVGTAVNQEEYQAYLDDFHAKNNLTILCHPEWSSTPARYFEKQKGNVAMEIWNTGAAFECNTDNNAAYWDEILGQGILIWGVAADDSHYFDIACRGWVMVDAENNIFSIFAALKEGRFYSSCGPEIFDLYEEGGKVYVECSPVKKIAFQSDRHYDRVTFAEKGTITRAELDMDHWSGPYSYIRVTIEDEYGQKAWSNPLILDNNFFGRMITGE